jgi:site-specific recombinase XerD
MKGIIAKLEQDMELRGFSEHTKDSYRRIVEIYLQYVSKPVAQTDEDDIVGYLEYLRHTRKLANTTVNQYLSAIWFLYEVVLNRQLNRKQVSYMKRPRKLPETLSRSKIAAIIDAAENTRHKAMIMLAYSAGLRVFEIASLRTADIDSENMRIFVRAGKGGKDGGYRQKTFPSTVPATLVCWTRAVMGSDRWIAGSMPLGWPRGINAPMRLRAPALWRT